MIASAVGLKTYIWNNNLKSALLIVCFPILILSMYFVGSFIYFLELEEQVPKNDMVQSFDKAMILFGNSWPIVLIGVGIWFFIAFLSHEKIINKHSGGHLVKREDQERVYNLLENLCISRGMSMPKLAVIDSSALNAFASGISKKSYTITLTTGLIANLNDQELEAVLAHELTHIINNDVRLLIVGVVFTGILTILAEWGFRITVRAITKSGKSKDSGKLVIFLILTDIFVLAIGYLLATLLRACLSRKHEYLADAGSVELTKNPDAMISALQKISDHSSVEHMSQSIKEMCIDGKPERFGIFNTHPPIASRIEALKQYAGGMTSAQSFTS